ncbi:MAG: GNAT family N-acetyltransferase [Alphaproteobacteria bacterium]|nr:GNAT family N-acetyltransferase [Alphaproteobacteria bacterium]
MIYTETQHLTLRSLERHELPRLVTLLNEWDVVRWLSVVPFPYTATDAEDFFAEIAPYDDAAEPQFFALSLKGNPDLIGGVGLHAPRTADAAEGENEIGYWLARDYWKRGLMREAVAAVIDIGFARPTITSIGATTDPFNHASQNVLRAAGLRDMGIVPRSYAALRGGDEVVRWLMTRADYESQRLRSGAA